MTVDPSAVTEAGTAGPASTELVPGTSVGKYRLDRVLGSGGMGVVWAAFDPDLERPVAIKVLRSLDSVDTLRTRLLREARAMARLKHPNVLTVYEVGTDRNRDYIAMELIDGSDLDGWLTTKPPRPEILAALLAAGRGLAAAHDAGLIHRDLKPHNILRGTDGRVYVTDFGLARGQIEDGVELMQTPLAATAATSGAQPRAADSVLDSPLTQTGMLIGTPAYMAPEQFAGRTPDPRSDQFAFCVTAWEALTGARPFAGKTLEELRLAASAGLVALPGVGASAGLPPGVHRVLARGLAPVPVDRWLDMHVLLQELEAALAPPRPSRVPWIAAGTLAVVGFLTGVALYTRSRTAPQTPPMPPSRSMPTIPKITIPPIAIPEIPTVPMPPMPPMPPVVTQRTPPSRSPSPRTPAPTAPMPALLRGGTCVPVSEAFGMAWTAERRRSITARHKGEAMLIAVTGLLEETRRDWIKMYQVACASPKTAEHQEQLACLLSARDEIAAATQELITEGGELSMSVLVPLAISVSGCKTDHDGSAERKRGRDGRHGSDGDGRHGSDGDSDGDSDDDDEH